MTIMDEATRSAIGRLDQLDPEVARAAGVDDLRMVVKAAASVVSAEAGLREAVDVARGRGRSWARIADALGVSRQAAQKRFARKRSS